MSKVNVTYKIIDFKELSDEALVAKISSYVKYLKQCSKKPTIERLKFITGHFVLIQKGLEECEFRGLISEESFSEKFENKDVLKDLLDRNFINFSKN